MTNIIVVPPFLQFLCGKTKNMWVTVVLIILFLVLAYVLFAPLDLYIDTATQHYNLSFGSLAQANVEAHQEELLRIRLKLFFMKFYFYPLRWKRTSKKKTSTKKAIGKSRKRLGLGKGLRLLRSFKVKRLLVDLDTGNCISNAKLYPLFAFLNYHVGSFHINFEGRTRMALHMQNRPIRIIKSFFNF